MLITQRLYRFFLKLLTSQRYLSIANTFFPANPRGYNDLISWSYCLQMHNAILTHYVHIVIVGPHNLSNTECKKKCFIEVRGTRGIHSSWCGHLSTSLFSDIFRDWPDVQLHVEQYKSLGWIALLYTTTSSFCLLPRYPRIPFAFLRFLFRMYCMACNRPPPAVQVLCIYFRIVIRYTIIFIFIWLSSINTNNKQVLTVID